MLKTPRGNVAIKHPAVARALTDAQHEIDALTREVERLTQIIRIAEGHHEHE